MTGRHRKAEPPEAEPAARTEAAPPGAGPDSGPHLGPGTGPDAGTAGSDVSGPGGIVAGAPASDAGPALAGADRAPAGTAGPGSGPVAEPVSAPAGTHPAEGEPTGTATAAGSAATEPNLLRSSTVMAVGTVLSRLLGFVRTFVILAVLGGAVVNDAYNLANLIPNVLYTLVAGGVLNAVFVPQLVRAMKRGDAEGEEYAHRLLTLSMLVLAAVTVAVTLAAPWVVQVWGGGWLTGLLDPSPRDVTAGQLALAATFAYWFLPQIFFYGLYTMFGQVLNARGSFGPMMWAPILNNVVVIATGGLALWLFTIDKNRPASVSTEAIVLIAGGTTLGIVVQALVLVPVMRRAGYRYRPRFDFRGHGLGKAGSLAKWTIALVAVHQAAYLVITNLTVNAGSTSTAAGGPGAGLALYQTAYLVLMLPHAIITVSLVTALLPRMSRAAAEGDLAAVGADVSSSLRLTGVAMVPIAVALAAFGPLLGSLAAGLGKITPDQALNLGVILSAFALGLVPFTSQYLLLRGFYAQEDTRTPFLLACVIAAANAGLAVVAFALTPLDYRTAAIALAYSLAYVIGFTVSARVLSRRVGSLDGGRVARTYARLALAAVLAAVPSAGAAYGIWLADDRSLPAAAGGVAAGATLGALLYLLAAWLLRVEEVGSLARMVRQRLRR